MIMAEKEGVLALALGVEIVNFEVGGDRMKHSLFNVVELLLQRVVTPSICSLGSTCCAVCFIRARRRRLLCTLRLALRSTAALAAGDKTCQ